MAIAYESGYAKAPHVLRNLVAASVRWQTLCSTFHLVPLTASAAAAFVHVGKARDFTDEDTGLMFEPRPRAIITFAGHTGHATSPGSFAVQGVLALTFEVLLPDEEAFTILGGTLEVKPDEETWARNQIGTVVREMITAMPTDMANYLQAQQIDLEFDVEEMDRALTRTKLPDGTATSARLPYFYASVFLFRYFSSQQ